MTIRAFEQGDDVAAMTEMLHLAYAPLAALGLRYNATHQGPQVTLQRLMKGHPFVAVSEGRIVGTITLYGPDTESRVPIFADPKTWHFGQFGVHPDFKGRGIGRDLHRHIVAFALGQGASVMALDTAAPAGHLIEMYARWGYQLRDRVSWDSTNYESVVMTKILRAEVNAAIASCEPSDLPVVFEIINDSAQAYKGVIPADRWHEPYMPMAELMSEIGKGVRFYGYYGDGRLDGVMGIQDVKDVTLIRHAYVRSGCRGQGIGGKLLAHLGQLTDRPVLIGTWKAATWAIRFYEANGFALVGREEKDLLLRTYWSVPDRQIEESIVLADKRWRDRA
ncbi:MAG TPA: GNAT family N-acetyltransferase [Opitutaceae bacterium]|jgi:GNAT superfamily N-acetyltransferase|nr:GNAT family N-acetyltransferase [Opitutaceae bacterium]